jgi:hypothetical protein
VRHAHDRETARPADRLEGGEVAASRATEPKVAADVNGRETQARREVVAEELFPGQRSQLTIERKDEHAVDAAAFERFQLLPAGLDQLRASRRRDDRQRMRIERDDDRRRGARLRGGRHADENGLVPEVHAVEVADRRHEGLTARRKGIERVPNVHAIPNHPGCQCAIRRRIRFP